MIKHTQETVNELRDAAASKADFMRELARMDTGELSADTLETVTGGNNGPGLIDLTGGVLGLVAPPPIGVDF